MLQFKSQSLLAMVSAVALLLVFVRSYHLMVPMLLFVMPLTLLLIGLTSPQSGNQLDLSQRWPFFLLAQTWMFTIAGLSLFVLIGLVVPDVAERTLRILNGDTAPHQFVISLPANEELVARLKTERFIVHDAQGTVGIVRGANENQTFDFNKNRMIPEIVILVSAFRLPDAIEKDYDVEVRDNNVLYLVEQPAWTERWICRGSLARYSKAR